MFGLVRSSSPPLAPVPLFSTIHTASAHRSPDGEGAESTSDALPSPPCASSPRSLSTDHEHLREARPADTSTYGIRASRPVSMAPDRPIKHEVSALYQKDWRTCADPNANSQGALLAFEEGTKPIRRYCVLTEEALEYRPTDQSGLVERSIAFKTVDCVEVEYEPSVQAEHLALRPFAVRLSDGRRLLFATEKPAERLRWLSELKCVSLDLFFCADNSELKRQIRSRSLIPTPHFSTARGVGNPHRFAVTATSDWSLTPPGSSSSETRGTVRSWTRDNARPHPSLPLSAAPSVPSITQQPWRQAAGEDDSARKLLDLDRSSTRSSAMRRLERSETPPPLPPQTARYLAHSPIPGPFSRERMPRATFGRDSTASTPVPSSSLLEELRELLAVLEVDDLRKKAKSSRYQRLRERLGAFKERLASDKSSTMSPHDAHLAEKVRSGRELGEKEALIFRPIR